MSNSIRVSARVQINKKEKNTGENRKYFSLSLLGLLRLAYVCLCMCVGRI